MAECYDIGVTFPHVYNRGTNQTHYSGAYIRRNAAYRYKLLAKNTGVVQLNRFSYSAFVSTAENINEIKY